MLILSDLSVGKVPDYLEFAWVTTPAATNLTITSNVWTTVTLNSKTLDTGNNGDIGTGPAPGIIGTNTGLTLSANQMGLKAGRYQFDVSANIVNLYGGSLFILALYNKSDETYISSISDIAYNNSGFVGQFSLSAPKVIDFRVGYYEGGGLNRSTILGTAGQTYGVLWNNTTTNSSTRASVKLWKVK